MITGTLVLATTAVAGWGVATGWSWADETPAATVPGAFAAAAQEFGVPQPLLMAYSYSLTGWRDHGGRPSAQGGYGLMHLTSADEVSEAGSGTETPGRDARLKADPALNTLTRAAKLLGEAPQTLSSDDTENIRGGAALLADEAKQLGAKPAQLSDWYPVVAELSGGSGSNTLADDVFATLRSGASDTQLQLAPQADAVVAHAAATTSSDAPECPAGLGCTYLPAAYASNDLTDANDYGNYDPANRPATMPIKYIVIHDTDSSYDSTVDYFQDPSAYTSAHYVIRSSDGHVTQMVRTKDIAWHAANSLINDESIGIEHEGYAEDGATWYTDAMYRNSATLVRYLAAKFHIPLDREHIIGHDDVANQRNYPDSHWDPGPYWDWDRYMQLLHAPAAAPGNDLVTIAPKFAANKLALTYCTDACAQLPEQSSSSVQLRSAPADDAPLLTDPVIGGGTTDAADWSDKAVTGRQYAVAARQGAWTAIWYGGQKAWLRSALLRPVAGQAIRPRAGVQVKVYPAAQIEAAEWPAGTPAGNPSTPSTPTVLYTISGDQKYQLADKTPAEIYYARFADNKVVDDRTVLVGAQTYYRISFNHRFMYVRSQDVEFC